MTARSNLITTTHCETSKDFIAGLSPRGEWYGSVAPRGWIFRGHPNDWFRLVPAALRNGSKELSELVLCSIANNKDQQWGRESGSR